MSGLSAHFNEQQRVAAALSQMFPDPGTTRPRGISSAGTGKRFLQLLVLSAGGGEGGRSSAMPRSSRPGSRPACTTGTCTDTVSHKPCKLVLAPTGARLGTTEGKEEQEEGWRQCRPLPVIPFYGPK